MLTAVHLLLTYACTMKCDHCFLYCAPRAPGTFTVEGIKAILDDLKSIESVTAVYFEGGEPFLFYPLLLEGVKMARQRGFQAGIVTNGYWGTSIADAKLWLKPLADLGLSDLSISDDELHYDHADATPAAHAMSAANEMGIPVHALCKKKPEVCMPDQDAETKGMPEISGGIKFRGRAVEKLAAGLPTQESCHFTACTFEALREPNRLHIDAYGNVHICQGILIGNCRQTTLSKLIRDYDPDAHPICGPLLRGGPFRLLSENNLDQDKSFVDACHCCYMTRLELIRSFGDFLGPRQVYGLEG